MVVLWNACKEVGGKTRGMKLSKFNCYLFGTVGRDAKTLHTYGASQAFARSNAKNVPYLAQQHSRVLQSMKEQRQQQPRQWRIWDRLCVHKPLPATASRPPPSWKTTISA
ncbi:MAG: hypothetical protein CMM02_05205 [Rhodopirellula sp.]|nr:hypothetical protein [Rhodopirellula sp.]